MNIGRVNKDHPLFPAAASIYDSIVEVGYLEGINARIRVRKIRRKS